jgi:hypothetical protein
VGPLLDGDMVSITIESIGTMTVPVVQGRGGTNIAFQYQDSIAQSPRP